jgi:SAM-dependent methyltransferase
LPARAALTSVDRLLGLPGRFEVLICDDCGTGCTAPPLEPSDLADLYPQGYGSHEGTSSGTSASLAGALKRAQIAVLLRNEPFAGNIDDSPGRALDVGCGRGDLAAALIARGWRVDGVELSERAGALASARGISVVGPTVAQATLATAAYDLVVMRHSLEHMLDPVGDLRRLRDALRPGGRAIISVPNFSSWQRRRFGSYWFHLDAPRHRVHFTPASLRLALQLAGLVTHLQFTTTSVLGLPASIQYLLVGKCVAPGGTRLRALAGLCCAVFPLTWLTDLIGRERDTLHTIARRD